MWVQADAVVVPRLIEVFGAVVSTRCPGGLL